MHFLALAIVCSASLPLLFRAFADWRVNVLWAIPANYFTCVILGSIFSGNLFNLLSLRSESWVYLAILQGGFLAGNFYLLAYTAQHAGVVMAALATRLSVAIPALIAFLLYGDVLNLPKIIGLVGALVSLYLSSGGGGTTPRVNFFSSKLLPVVLFVSFGFHFSLLKFAQQSYLKESSHHLYVMLSFFFAFWVSLSIVLPKVYLKAAGFRLAHVSWGVFLGGLNYGAVYFLVRLLSLDGWESSQVFPTYSGGVVIVSSALAVLLFSERFSRAKAIGLVVGVVAVALLNQ